MTIATRAQCNTTLHKLTPESSTNNDDRFGSTIAANSQYMVVAAENSDTLGILYGGAAFVYEKTAAGWAYRAMLTASDPDEYDFFGNEVAIDETGNTIVVINRNYTHGAAYIFEKPASGWTTMQETYNIKFPEYLEFNSGLDISDDGSTIAVSNPMSRNGQLYVLEKPSGGWNSSIVPETLLSTGGNNYVGNDVLVEGGYIYTSVEHEGSVIYVFKKNGSSYTKIAHLKTSADAYNFGFHLTMNNNTLAATGLVYPSASEAYYAMFLFTKVGEWANGGETVISKLPETNAYGSSYPIHFISPTEIIASPLVKEGAYYTGKILKFTTMDGSWQDISIPVIFEEPELSVPSEFGNQLVWNGTELLMSAVRKNVGSGNGFRNSVLSLARSGGIWGSLQKVSLPRKSSSSVNFGTSIVKTSDAMFAGAPYDGTVGRGAGAVYVYNRLGDEFEKIHTIYPSPRKIRPTGGSDAAFGFSLAAYGNELAIGAPSFLYAPGNYGKVFMYRRNTNDWRDVELYDSLMVPPELDLNHLGTAIAMNDNVLFASAYNNLGDAHTNAVVIFERANDKWHYRQLITMGKPLDKSWPSIKFSLHGDVLAVGEYFTIGGGVSLLQKNATGDWEVSVVVPGDVFSGFGGAVNLNENHLFVGAPGVSFNNLYRSGAVYVFSKLPGSSWNANMQPSAIIAPQQPIEGGFFGSSLDVIGNTMAVGAPGMFLTFDSQVRTIPGNTYIIQASDYHWKNTTQYLTLHGDRYDANERDHFGSYVTLDQEYFYIGARSEHTSTGRFSGSLYYVPTPPVIFLEPPMCADAEPFQLVAYPAGGMWSGPGVNSTGIFNPAVSGTGMFQLTYQTPNCAYLGSVQLEVMPPITIEQLSPPEVFICNDGATTLKIKPIDGAEYNWYYRQNDTDSFMWMAKDDDAFDVINPGEYKVIISSTCPEESPLFRVKIEGVNVTVGPQPVVCDVAQPVSLIAVGHSGVWEGQGVSNNEFNPSGLTNGYYKLIFRITTALGCHVSVKDSIKMNAVSPFTLMQTTSDFCETGSAILTATPVTSGVAYTWYFKETESAMLTSINQSIDDQAEVYAQGYYQVSASNGECTNTSNFLQVGLLSDLSYTFSPPEGTTVQLCNTNDFILSVNAREGTGYTWLYKAGEGDIIRAIAGEDGHELAASETGFYAVRGEYGFCSFQSALVSLQFNYDHLFVPNVFTPNGDSKNAVFKAETTSSISRFSIFNRNGKMLYNNTSAEWDGGEAPSGVYFWSMKYLGCDDQEREAKGWVHLIR